MFIDEEHSEHCWTNRDDYFLISVTFRKGFAKWSKIINDKSGWSYSQKEQENWKNLFKKFDQKPTRILDHIDPLIAKKYFFVSLSHF